MKYFKLQEAPEGKRGPQIMNWYGSFDVRNIRMEGFPKIPKRQLYMVEPVDLLIFTDIILFPFLLVSPEVKRVIEMYREQSFYREVILLNQKTGVSKLYYLPVFNETADLDVVERSYKNGRPAALAGRPEGTRFMVNRHIFWARDARRRHTIVSLDLAESILKREAVGVGLKEVELYGKSRRP